MDKYIDSRFERVEKALATLIDSISKYNPSSAQASDLTLADKQLAAGLEDLQTHQNNYLRILSLRKTTAALDEQIKATLSTLALTRKDITGTTTTTYPDGPRYDVSYEELLSYARRISRTTLPPHAVTNGIDGGPDADGKTGAQGGDAAQPGSADQTAGQTPASTAGANGAPTPLPGTGTALGSQQPTTAPTPSGVATPGAETQQQQQQPQSSSFISLPEELQARLLPPSSDIFTPWPPEPFLRSGSLALLHQLADSGLDAATYDPAAEEARRLAAEAERKEAEEKARQAREAHEARMAEERERMRALREREREKEDIESWRRGSVVVVDGAAGAQDGAATRTTAAGGTGRKQFQFLGDLDDDEDDD